jgi:hypothetical protein
MLARRPSVGPLFQDWVATDWGWAWVRDREILRDSENTTAFDDPALNLLVIVVTRDPSSASAVHHWGENEAILFRWTPYETTVTRTADTLIVADCTGRQEALPLLPGGARTFYDLATRNRNALLLDVLIDSEITPDAQRLRQLVERVR